MDLADKKENLIRTLREEGYLKTSRVVSAMRQIKREDFVPATERAFAYSDTPLSIGSGQTISAPHMVAIMTEMLRPKANDIVLEVGSGSGYQAAVLSQLVKRVFTVELEETLASQARKNLRKSGVRNVEIMKGDGSKGLPDLAPFDSIIVTCASDRIYPAWEKQLREGGRLLVPVDSGAYQDLILCKKVGTRLEKRQVMKVSFVPLRH